MRCKVVKSNVRVNVMQFPIEIDLSIGRAHGSWAASGVIVPNGDSEMEPRGQFIIVSCGITRTL